MWLKSHTNYLYCGLEYGEIFVIENRLPAINDSGSWRLPHRLLQALLVTPRIVGSGKSIFDNEHLHGFESKIEKVTAIV